MRRTLMQLAVVSLGLTMTAAVQAKGPGGSMGHPMHSMPSYVTKHISSSTVHHTVSYKTSYSKSSISHSRPHYTYFTKSNFYCTSRCWCRSYGCYCYWCPSCSSYCCWYEPWCCYIPYSEYCTLVRPVAVVSPVVRSVEVSTPVVAQAAKVDVSGVAPVAEVVAPVAMATGAGDPVDGPAAGKTAVAMNQAASTPPPSGPADEQEVPNP